MQAREALKDLMTKKLTKSEAYNLYKIVDEQLIKNEQIAPEKITFNNFIKPIREVYSGVVYTSANEKDLLIHCNGYEILISENHIVRVLGDITYAPSYIFKMYAMQTKIIGVPTV